MFNHQNKYAGLGEAVFIVCLVTFIVLLILSSYFFGGSATIGGILIIMAVSMVLILIWDFFRYGVPWLNPTNRKIKKGAVAGYIDPKGYSYILFRRKRYSAARLAFFYMTGRWPFPEIDHIDRNRDNNVWNNLREATRTQQLLNSKPRTEKRDKDLPIRVYRHKKQFQVKCGKISKYVYSLEEANQIRKNYLEGNGVTQISH